MSVPEIIAIIAAVVCVPNLLAMPWGGLIGALDEFFHGVFGMLGGLVFGFTKSKPLPTTYVCIVPAVSRRSANASASPASRHHTCDGQTLTPTYKKGTQ